MIAAKRLPKPRNVLKPIHACLTSILQWRIIHRQMADTGRKFRTNGSVAQDQLLMLLIYPKNIQDDLTPSQVKSLRQVVEAEYP